MSEIPADLKYTAEHEWVSAPNDEGIVRVGITDFAQDALGDIVYVQMPEAGTAITGNDVVGEVESTKSVSDIYAPLSGEVVARNEDLDADPALLNSAQIRVRMPNGVMSASGDPPDEPPMIDGNRSPARDRIAPPDMSCRRSESVGSVSAPTGRFGTPPGVVTAAPPARPP